MPFIIGLISIFLNLVQSVKISSIAVLDVIVQFCVLVDR